MLEKLKVMNYKSLQDIELNFGKFNVLIGKNASGKSNIIDCLKFLNKIPIKLSDEIGYVNNY